MNPPTASKPKKEPTGPAGDDPAAAGKKPDYQTNMPVGEILRRAREHFGQSLTDVAAALRIRAIQLDAIEKSQYDKLPGRVYAIGFVRSYSEYLGFDGDKMVALFKSQSTGGGRIKPELNFPAPASESRVPPLGLVIACLAVFISFMVVWATSSDSNPEAAAVVPDAPSVDAAAPASVPSIPAPSAAGIPLKADAAPAEQTVDEELAAPSDEVTGEAAPAEAKAATELTEEPKTPAVTEEVSAATEKAETPATEAPAAAEQDGITLNVTENSWVEIKDASGKAIVSRMLKKGDQYFVPNRPDLVMSLGNAGGIDIVMDGKTLPPLGKKGEVRRNVSLDMKSLAAGAE